MDTRDVSIGNLKGIGPQRIEMLKKMDIQSIDDLLFHVPRSYQDLTKVERLTQAISGNDIVVVAKILSEVKIIRKSRKMSIYKISIEDESGKGECIWFNQPFIKKQLTVNTNYLFWGKVQIQYGKIQIINPSFADRTSNFEEQKIFPIYSLTGSLSQKIMRTIIKNALDLLNGQQNDPLPYLLREKYHLAELNFAISNIHFPVDMTAMNIARRRLVFEELLYFQLALRMTREEYNERKQGIVFRCSDNEVTNFIKNLPFRLTEAQEKVLNEIFHDMSNSTPMNRLIQGDVGSGKTIVAIISLFIAVVNGYQGAMMVPTEILAKQHYQTFIDFFSRYDIKVGILKGSLSKRQREEALNAIKGGEWNITIGTHSLIQNDVEFNKLGLVITDEQHRFGVRQRALLSSKGILPDVLVMSATPIPRTLALILYGDLDISIIDQLPAGRKKIKTYYISHEKRDGMYGFIRKEVLLGRQAYIVCPLVDNSDNIDAKSAVDNFNDLSTTYLKGLKLGLLHGKMKANEKDKIMNLYKEGKIDVLVSTTVIEVGVNVPNAAIMAIENAERFGMAQLHQLRGRVGRGEYQSYCFLLSNTKSTDSYERLKTMTHTDNGFVIAEKDLEMRGPGEFMGTKQHGMPELKVADLIHDIGILEETQRAVNNILEGILPSDEFFQIQQAVKAKYKQVLRNITMN